MVGGVLGGVTGIILAGGKGSRLGGADKARLEIGGISTLDRVRGALSELVRETILVVNEDRPVDASAVRFLRDPRPHGGVLPALHAALEAANEPICLLVACDMPFICTALLSWLLRQAEGQDVVIPLVGGQLQPMHAVYRRDTCRAAIETALSRGDRRMISFLDGLHVRRIEETEVRQLDPDLRSFFNINTTDDLSEARRLAASH